MVFDLMKPWPFEDSTVQGIYASHVLEHLPDPMFFFREAYRVLEDRCLMQLRVPYGGHRAAWCDPTHLRPWFPESFAFLQPGYYDAIHNPQHAGWDAPFVVDHTYQLVEKSWARWLKWRLIHKLMEPWLGRIPDVVEELWIGLFPLKEQAALEWWKAHRPANAVPVALVMYEHDWEGRVHQDGERLALINISDPAHGRVV
jgi:SAM-dependent methyltransferase